MAKKNGAAKTAEKTTVRVWGDVSPDTSEELHIQAIRTKKDFGKHVGEILTRSLKEARRG